MMPNIKDYKILSMDGKYYVLDPYDLFSMPCLKIIGEGHINRVHATEYLKQKFARDMRTYERLKSMGRSFPDND